MSIQIIVNDPANTHPNELRLVQALLQRFIDRNVYEGMPEPTIASDDLPDAGQFTPQPNTAFSAAAGNPNAAFATSAAPVPSAAEASAAFAGAGPNVALSTPTNGTAPAPGNGSQMVGASVPVDSKGFPHDARIHASNKDGGVKNADGSWRAKRGVDAALVSQVEYELRATMGAPAVPNGQPSQAPAPSGTPAQSNVSPPALVGTNPPSATPAALTNAAPLPPGQAQPATTGTPAPVGNFIELIGKVSALVNAGRITQEQVSGICASVGLVGGLPMLANRADLVASVDTLINMSVPA